MVRDNTVAVVGAGVIGAAVAYAPTRGCLASSRTYLLTSEGANSTADPRRVTGAAAGMVNAWSKPYCSSTAPSLG